MLNVDGVIHGNNRCCLVGMDLNRKWKEPNKVNLKKKKKKKIIYYIYFYIIFVKKHHLK